MTTGPVSMLFPSSGSYTFEVPLVRGRAFTAADREGSQDVAIVSEDIAAQTWPGQDPIGKRLKMGGLPDPKPKWHTVIGVAATAHFTEMLEGPLTRPRFNAFLLSIFGIAALLLSTIGLYAVMAAYVRQRDREIALRLALGATASAVRGLVLAEAPWLAGFGAVLGLAGAAGATRLLRGMLFEVDPLDPLSIVGAALLLMAAAVVASYVPVRQATRVDATAMLRSDY